MGFSLSAPLSKLWPFARGTPSSLDALIDDNLWQGKSPHYWAAVILSGASGFMQGGVSGQVSCTIMTLISQDWFTDANNGWGIPSCNRVRSRSPLLTS